LMERFDISHVYGMHNMPGIAAGTFAIRPGAIMAATAKFTITVNGRGAHAAQPHASVDPVVVAAQIVTALQTIVSRRVDPLNSLVVTVTRVDAGTAFNVIPQTVELWGTTRALDLEVAAEAEGHIRHICEAIARSAGASAHVDYLQAHPPVMNRLDEAELAAQVAREIVGAHAVDAATRPVLAGEDFSHMLVARPGAFIFIGNGESAALHHPAYDFDDSVLAAGVSYWVRLAQTRLAPAMAA
jgi:amidohydrolase